MAFASRVTLHLEYPDLDETRRIKIWNNFLEIAKIGLYGEDMTSGEIGDIDGVEGTSIPAVPLNGRQIRNIMRLIKLLYPEKCTPEQIVDIAKKYTCTIGSKNFKEQLLSDPGVGN